MTGYYDPDSAGMRVVETRTISAFGSVTVGVGVDEQTREPVCFVGDSRTMRDFAAALAEGVPYVLALVPPWAVLTMAELTLPDPEPAA